MSYDWIALLLLVLSHQYPGPRRGHTLSGPQKTFFWILHFVRFFILDFFRFLASGTRASQPSKPTRGEAYEPLATDCQDELGPTLLIFLDFAFFNFFVQQSFFSKWNEDIRTIQVNTRRSLRTIDYR